MKIIITYKDGSTETIECHKRDQWKVEGALDDNGEVLHYETIEEEEE